MVTLEQLKERLLYAEDHKGRLDHYLRGQYTEPMKVRRAINVLSHYYDKNQWPHVFVIGKCPIKGCKHTQRVPIYTKLTNSGYATNTESLISLRRYMCPEHSANLRFQEVKGSYNPNVPCDRRCTGARGHKCECSCGGTNHGKDFDE